MASIVRIKRSTGNTAPGAGNLNYGELGVTIGSGTQGDKGERLFVGNASNNPIEIGGKYYTDLINNAPGVVDGGSNASVATNGFIPIMDRNSSGNPGGGGLVNNLPRVNQWSVDNLTLDANTISSNNTDGDIILRTNGSGEVVIPDDQFLTFGDSKDSRIEYNENGDDKVHVTGAPWVFNNDVIIGGGGSFGAIGISSNIISTKSGSGNTLYIDPYPDGLSNEGTVVIKGDLQVDGTQTTVNSTEVSSNETIFKLGDVTSKRTTMAAVGSGTSSIQLDSVVGINTGDTISHAAMPGAGTTTVYSYIAPGSGVGLGTVFIDGVTTAGIAVTTQVTITHAYDTNTDRGISFQYNTSSGTANTKLGFYGYVDGDTNGQSNAPARSWTYIPDATITNSAVSGTRGYLDIKGLYHQTGDYETHGVAYYTASGLTSTTNAPTDATFTSNHVMTAVTEIVLTLDGNHTFAAGDQILQGANRYGMVKTSTTASNTVTLIGVTGTFNTSDTLTEDGVATGRTPTNVSTTYTDKPMWTTTIDGGTF